jgi:hypothetical protein
MGGSQVQLEALLWMRGVPHSTNTYTFASFVESKIEIQLKIEVEGSLCD